MRLRGGIEPGLPSSPDRGQDTFPVVCLVLGFLVLGDPVCQIEAFVEKFVILGGPALPQECQGLGLDNEVSSFSGCQDDAP